MEKKFGRAALILFLSGFAGLIHETVWLKILHLLLGNSLFAGGIVFIAFMAGLALGAVAIDPLFRHRPRRGYQFIEMALCGYALALPAIQRLLEKSYYLLSQPTIPPWVKFLPPLAVVFIPAFLMGGTLPLSEILFAPGRGDFNRVYSFNTLGAALGTLVGGLFLLPAMGITATLGVAGIANLAVASLLGGVAEEPGVRDIPPLPESNRDWESARQSLAIAGLLGFLGLSYEISLSHILTLMLGSSVFAYSTILFAYILGIGIGPVALRGLHTRSIQGLLFVLAGVLYLNAVAAQPLFFEFHRLYKAIGHNFHLLLLANAIAVFLILAPFTFLNSYLFTRLAEEWRGRAPLSRFLAANTLGGVVGSALTAFFLLERCGIVGTIQGLATLIGVVLLLDRAPQVKRGAAMALGILYFAWVDPNPQLLTSAPFYRTERYSHIPNGEAFARIQDKQNLLFFQEDGMSVVSVHEDPTGRILKVNGKVDASDREDMPTQRLISHLPALIKKGPLNEVLVVGLGSGVTAASIDLHHPRHVDVVELSPGVIHSAPFFRHINRAVWENPRVSIIEDDARHFLATRHQKFDLILSEPSNPWMAGVASLFTREHFLRGLDLLQEEGLYAQWIQTYEISKPTLSAIGKTFVSVFPHATLWQMTPHDLLFIGSKIPQTPDLAVIAPRFSRPEIYRELRESSFLTPTSFLAAYIGDETLIRALFAEGQVNTDDQNFVEFQAPRDLNSGANLIKENNFLKNYLLPDTHPLFTTSATLTGEDFAGLGFFLYRLSLFREAAVFFQKGERSVNPSPLCHLIPAHMDHLNGKHDRCSERLYRFHNSDPATWVAEDIRLASEICMDHQAWEHAIKFLEKLPSGTPDMVGLSGKMAECYMHLGELETARLISEEVLRKFPRDPYQNYLQGLILRKAGEEKMAWEKFEKLAWHPELGSDCYLQLGIMSDSRGEAGTATDFLRLSLKLDPHNHKTLDYLATREGDSSI